MKYILASLLLLTTTLVAQTSTTVINNGKLTTDLNANTKSLLDVTKIGLGAGAVGTLDTSIHILPNGTPTTTAYGIKWGNAGVVLYQTAEGALTLVGDLTVDGTIGTTAGGIVDLSGANTFTGANEFQATTTVADLILSGDFAVANDTVRNNVRAALDLVPNTTGDGSSYDVQAYSAKLTDIRNLTPADGAFLVGNGTTWVAEAGSDARTSIGLGTGASPTFTNQTLSGTLSVGGVSTLTGKVTASGGLQFASGGTWGASGSGTITNDPLVLGSTLAVTGDTTLTGVVTLGSGGLTLTSSGTTATLAGTLVANVLTLATTPLAVTSGGSGLASVAAGNFLYTNGSNTFAATAITTFGRSLVDDATAADARTTLELSTAGGDLTGTYPNPTIGADKVALGTDTTGLYVLSLADSGAGSFVVMNGAAEGGAATIALNSNGVTLNTHTAGDYVATVTAGTGVTITGSGTEARAATISIGQAVDTGASPTFAGITVSTLTIAGGRVMTSSYSSNAIEAANSVWGGTNALVFEGSTADGNETFVVPANPTSGRTITLPDATTTLVGRDTTDTLTNKTLTAPIIATISNTGVLTLPTSTDTLVGRTTTDTLTNKTLSLTSNTLTSTSAQLATALSDETGSSTAVFSTSPTLTTPVLKVPALVDSGDVTKVLTTDLSDATTGTTRTIVSSHTAARSNTIPDTDGTFMLAQDSVTEVMTASRDVDLGQAARIAFTSNGTWAITLTTTNAITGQIYYLLAPPTNAVTLADSGIHKLSAAWTPNAGDVLVLWFDGTNFYEVSRSAN